MNKNFLPYDIYERHRKVSGLISPSHTVLDFGGELNHLGQFVRPKKLVVANLDTGDVIITKTKIPFENNSFDCVCAIDVLEHIPKKDREKFIEKLTNIASHVVILSFPIGTDEHINYEQQTLEWLKARNQKVTYLEEHIKNGLPQIDEINKLLRNRNSKVSFSGNLKLNETIFKIYMFDPKIKFIRKLVYYSKLLFNFLANPFLYRILIDKKYSDTINRAYIVINK